MSESSLTMMVDMPRPHASRRRAPALSSEERRATIIKAALPLLAEHGTSVTTSQIAAAAGIAEGTVFRVFSDKQELVASCVGEAMCPEKGLDELRAVPRDMALPQRLSWVAHTMTARISELGALMHVLASTGYRIDRAPQDPKLDRDRWLREAVAAVVDVIGSDAAGLRLPPERTARMLLGMVFTSQFAMRLRRDHTTRPQREDVDELIDVFLHGVLTDQSAEPAKEHRCPTS